MPKLPQVSGADVIRYLQKLGYEAIRQKGSHVQLKKQTRDGEHTITVPNHSPLAKGTLNDIINRVSARNEISKDDVLAGLK